MALDAHKNFGFGTVVTPPSPPTSGTSVVLATGDAASLPTPPFNATVWPQGNMPLATNAEVVRVTNRVGDTLTITRAQEFSTARPILIGDQLAATFTVKFVDDMVNASNLASGVLPDACIPQPDLKVIGGNTTSRLILGTTFVTSNLRHWEIFNYGPGSRLYIRPIDDAFNATITEGLSVDRSGNVFAQTALYERGRSLPMGNWNAVGYNAGNFSAAAGAWTVDAGDLLAHHYILVGRTMWVFFNVQTTSVSVATNELRIALPFPVAAPGAQGTFSYMDGSVAGTGVSWALTGETAIRLRKDFYGATNWPIATNANAVAGQIAIPI